LLKDPRILLLDEPTSELDVENQGLILDVIFALKKGKTILFITHHIQTVERADQIYFISNGSLVEQAHSSTLR
jgi:ABC-type multidrug transport system fused ATPase/permease subunit